jgi:FtsP/CotA-like multicopper oxidase with cupredoxin domain
MNGIYLPRNASKARLREAERARENRLEIVRERSWGRVSRRELFKMGIFTAAGLLAPIRGLNPFVGSASAQATGLPPSPLFGVKPFTQPMPRFDVLPRHPITRSGTGQLVSCLSPAPTAEANQTMKDVNPLLGGNLGPIEGRPPGPIWAHQGFNDYPPQIAVEAVQAPATTNYSYHPEVASSHNSGIDPTHGMPLCFHPGLPIQRPESVWTFNGTIPPKLVQGRYGEPLLFRHHNGLPYDIAQNGGFGRHTISTHEHNGHHGAENDGFTGAFFFPGQFYDYHWPIVLAGFRSINTGATDPRASSPTDSGGLMRVAGDWRETMSTHWFHDHMFSFTSQNVYKGNAAMFNIYSGLDRGAEDIIDGVNLRLPSGSAADTGKSWGNLQYDVNLMVADKAFDRDGQLIFDIFNDDGFLGDVMTVNLAATPYFEVEPRKYRFRILNAAVARFFKIALVYSQGNNLASGTPVEMFQIANDGNLLPQRVPLTELDEQGIAERYDVVIDFSRFSHGSTLHFVNLADHFDPEEGGLNGKKPVTDLTVAEALSGRSLDPCVGRFLEFRVVRELTHTDESQVPETLIPNPDLSNAFVSRERTFLFGRGANQTIFDAIIASNPYAVTASPDGDPWGIGTDGGEKLGAAFSRVSAAPNMGSCEIWHLVNDGGGWDHPIHIHFEEGQIIARDGLASNVPPWEQGRKDVYRLRPGGSVTIKMQFRDWGGMFMEHCHNTTHEDFAMLLRWEINDGGSPFLRPLPTPIPSPQGVTFRNPAEVLPTAF